MIVKLIKFKMVETTTRKYNEFSFSDSVNIITGGNTKGKSTFIKSLMYALGFNIIKWPKRFSIKNFILQLEFSIDGEKHEIIRNDKVFVLDKTKVYLSEGEFKGAFNKLFDIKLKLNHKQNNITVAPYPTDTLLFNYIDQDSSYSNLFKGNHKSISMYKLNEVYRIYKYLLEIEDSEIAELRDRKSKKNREKTELEKKKKNIEGLFKDIAIENSVPITKEEFDSAFEIFIKNLERLLKEKNKLEYKRYSVVKKIKELEIERLHLENTYEELENKSSEVSCKFCHSPVLEETFTKNYKKELNKTAILQLYVENKESSKNKESALNKVDEDIKKFIDEIENIEKNHSKKHNEMNLNKILKSNANFRIKETISKENIKIIEKIDLVKDEIKNIEKSIRTGVNSIKTKKDVIEEKYNELLEEISQVFNNSDFGDFKGKFMTFKINQTGVQDNIAHIALYYTYFKLLSNYSKVKFPIIWDSFIKETFDEENSSNLDNFINNNLLKLNNQILVSNIPDGKDVKIIENNNYNYISIGNKKICHKDNRDTENNLLDYIFEVIK